MDVRNDTGSSWSDRIDARTFRQSRAGVVSGATAVSRREPSSETIFQMAGDDARYSLVSCQMVFRGGVSGAGVSLRWAGLRSHLGWRGADASRCWVHGPPPYGSGGQTASYYYKLGNSQIMTLLTHESTTGSFLASTLTNLRLSHKCRFNEHDEIPVN